ALGKRPGVHRLLCALNQQIQAIGDLTALLESIVAAICGALNPMGCIIWLRADPAGPDRRIAVWTGSRPPAYLVDNAYDPYLLWSISPVAGLKDTLLRTALLEAGMSLVIPLIYQGEIIGWLGVGPILAGQATLAIQSIRLKTELETSVSQLRRAYQQTIQAQENERRQLAEALHDETLQHLADISVRLGLLRSRSEVGPADLEDIQTRLARADRYLREMVRGVHPAILSDLGLIEAVIAFLETLPPNHCPAPVRVELCVTGFNEQRLPDQNLELALYRFMQNGAVNALTHGRPAYIRVELKWGQDAVEVQVKDDGCGMNTTIEEATRAGHFGLLTMRERIEAIGGNFVASSGPGRGTQVMGRVPVTTPSPAPGQVERYIFDLA
ncbi:MAG: hypothetical protein HYR94_29360, partial [Chloroflexi bacterium]|nr:hypothetical protein [Chloroflexota bacterium]